MAREFNRAPVQDRASQPTSRSWWLGAALFVPLAAAALAMGAVHTPVLTTLCLATIVLTAAVCFKQRLQPLTLFCSAVAGYCLLQAVPLVPVVVTTLNPQVASLWTDAAEVLSVPASLHLSADPAASIREAGHWLLLAAMTCLGAAVGQQSLRLLLLAGWLSALLLALVTGLHTLLGISNLYGIYSVETPSGELLISPLINPNNRAGYLNIGLFCGLGLATLVRRKTRSWVLLLSLPLAGLIAVSGSRAGTATFIVCSLGALWIGWRPALLRQSPSAPRGLPWSLTLLAGSVAFVFLATLATRWEAGEGGANIDKLKMLFWAVPLVAAHPWTGVGAGAFGSSFPPYTQVPLDRWEHPENFVVGWVAEMGLPVALLMLFFLAWQLHPKRLIRGSSARALAALGVYGWFAQNLVDLAITTPACTALVFSLTAGLTASRGQQQPSADNKVSAWKRPSPMLLALLVASGVVARGRVPRTAVEDRRVLFNQSERSDSMPSWTALAVATRSALTAHPGDPYLWRLLARTELQLGNKGSALRALGMALRRDPLSSANHEALAFLFAASRRTPQALVHLKIAAELNPHRSSAIARTALSWTTVPEQLLRVAPAGDARSLVLSALAKYSPPARRAPFLREAVSCCSSAEAQAELLEHLLSQLESDPGCSPSSEQCISEAHSSISALRNQGARPDWLPMAQARLDRAQGKPSGAIASELLSHCTPNNTECLLLGAELSKDDDGLFKQAANRARLSACPVSENCIATLRRLGNLQMKSERWRDARRSFEQAAKLSDLPRDWLDAARAAHKDGRPAAAARAHRNAKEIETRRAHDD